MAKTTSLVTSLTHSSISRQQILQKNDLDPRAAPKCLLPSIVTLMPVSLNTSLAACSRSGLMINQHFLALGPLGK